MMVERLIATAPTLMGRIESPSDEKARCHRDGDKVIDGSPGQILDHLPVGGTREFDRSHNVSWIVADEHNASRLDGHVRSRPNRDSDVRSRQRGRVVHAQSKGQPRAMV